MISLDEPYKGERVFFALGEKMSRLFEQSSQNTYISLKNREDWKF